MTSRNARVKQGLLPGEALSIVVVFAATYMFYLLQKNPSKGRLGLRQAVKKNAFIDIVANEEQKLAWSYSFVSGLLWVVAIHSDARWTGLLPPANVA